MFLLFVILFFQAALGQTAPSAVTDVRLLKLSPRIVTQLDTSKIAGDPVGLALRSDGAVYLRFSQGKNARHYQLATNPVSFGQLDGLPAWAADYWTWKSGIKSPGDQSLKMDVEQRRQADRTVNTPSAGDIAGTASGLQGTDVGGETVPAALVAAAASNQIMNGIVTIRFKGQVVGEWINEVPQLGMRFGWAPAPMRMLAYTDTEGQLFLIDADGHKVPVRGVMHALLPAWSPDGRRILCLQKKDRALYDLTEITIQ